MLRSLILAACALSICGGAMPLAAQQHEASPQVGALLLSDIHFDPYANPLKVKALNKAAAGEWPAILNTPDSPTRVEDTAVLSGACKTRGLDTPDVLWRSSLAAIHADAAHVRFVTISGDLLAHAFDCKYKAIFPGSTHAGYVGFVEKTIRYVVSSLRETLPGVPIYVALGNNDSGCTDYQLAPEHDDFLAATAKVIAEGLPEADREAVLRDFPAGGNYDVPLAGVPNTRLIVLDDLYLSSHYASCGDPAGKVGPDAKQVAWLTARLAQAREKHESAWVLGHIPPGVDLYSTVRKLTDVCGTRTAVMYLGSEAMAEALTANADVVKLALFGHTHSDEMRLLGGVPVKLTPSITPVNGNLPTFTVAKIAPATAVLTDYTVFAASNKTGVAATWKKEYTYSADYHEKAFSPEALTELISGFQADAAASTPASKAYLRNYFPGDASSVIQFAWPQYACSLNHDSAAAFADCVCAAAK